MKDFENINDVLDFAIAREQGAVDFYTRLSGDVNNKEMRDIFVQFAKEEMGHKGLLMKIKREGKIEIPMQKIVDLKIADYIVPEAKGNATLTYPEALQMAMRREKAAHELYKKLAITINDQTFRQLFESLAQEELKHKLRFETEYDDYLSKEN